MIFDIFSIPKELRDLAKKQADAFTRIESRQAEHTADIIKLSQQVRQLHTEEVKIMSEQIDALKEKMEALIAEVERNTSVDQSAVIAIQGLVAQQQALSQQLADALAANDSEAIQAAADEIAKQVSVMAASADALAAAIPTVEPQPE